MTHGRYTDDTSTLSFYQLTEKYPDEAAAIDYFTKQRWPDGPYCPSCGDTDVFQDNRQQRLPRYNCKGCKHQFTVTSGTVMENTKLPLRKWLWAFHMLGGAKKSIPARHIARQLGITLKTAWHLGHRIRATMTKNDQRFTGTVETDETYIGGKRKHVGSGYRGNKVAVQTIVERNRSTSRYDAKHGRFVEKKGRAQTIALDPVADKVDGRTVGAKLRTHTDPEKTVLNTDESPIYTKVGEHFKAHDTINHKKGVYVATDPLTGRVASTNTAEGLFGNLKRQITGTHHSTSKRHLPRYLEEYDHKYNNRDKTDTEITEAAIKNIEGRRVTLFKSASGIGDSLFERKETEKGMPGTERGQAAKRRAAEKQDDAGEGAE